MQGYSSANDAIRVIAESLFVVALVLSVLVTFGADVGQVLLTFGTVLVSTSFAAGEPIRNMLHSLIFIIGFQAFDVGDRVVLDGGVTSYVHSIGLLTCTFRTLTAKRYVVATHRLIDMTIQNHQRSPKALLEVLLKVGWRTTPEQLDKLITGVVEWVR